MKAITLYVSEPVYREFQNIARHADRTAAELIREAMDDYLRSREKGPRRSLADLRPVSVGAIKKPLRKRADLVGDMMDAVRA